MVAIGGRKRAQLQVQVGVKKGLFFQWGHLSGKTGPIEDTAA
jgi:hypothetical protein